MYTTTANAKGAKVKLSRIFENDVELMKKHYVHTTTTTAIATTTSTTIMNAITTGAKSSSKQISGNVGRILNKIKLHYVHIGCQRVYAISQEPHRVIS